MTDSEVRKSLLPSGMTLVTERMPERGSLSLGVWVRSGSRDEPSEQLGISHFIEHMVFKGTERRDARAIARSLESLGGHLDAFTSREQVCYYARSLAEHLPSVVDVLADITCHSRFAAEDIAREQSVVREEIFACDDNPDDRVGEMLGELLWGGHALGLPILGTVETVNAFDTGTLRDYFARRYRGDQLLISAAGALDHDALAEAIETAFAPPPGAPAPLNGEPPGYTPAVRCETRPDLQQLYVSLGTRGLSYADPSRFALHVMHVLLGGGMSSRLFQSVREEAGLAYAIYSAVDFYRDAGFLGIQMGVAPERGREALVRVRDELARLREDGPDVDEVEAAKSQIRGGILIGQESVSNRMVHLANDELYLGRFVPVEEDLAHIMAVTREEVAEAARVHLDASRFSMATLGPKGAAVSTDDWPVG